MDKTNKTSDVPVSNAINKLASSISSLSEKTKRIKGRKPELIAVILYFAGHLLMMMFHEPWFDEAVAWLIARDSSLKEILFTAPHYEGHPSLWSLILVPFAKTGIPYEFSLNFVSLLFSGTAMVLFIYKAPFKRIIRLLMPFTYFMFYQYGVVSRPYCMVMLAFVLLSLNFKKKEEHPGRFILSLCFLCMTSAYGIIIAGGICIAWLTEMFSDSYHKSINKNSENGESRGTVRIFIEDYLFHKGKIIWLILLLALALFTIIRIIPADDTFAVLNAEQQTDMGFFLRILYTSVGMVSDLFITNTYSYGVTLTVSGLSILEILPAVVIGIPIIFVLFKMAKRKELLVYFLLPYIMLVVSMACLYMSRHHMGILLLFILFFLWVYSEKDTERTNKETIKGENKSLFSSVTTLFIAIGIIIPLYWGISSSIIDIVENYSSGREEYKYLKEKNLLEKSILAEWGVMPDTNRGETTPITFSGVITELLPYLEEDTFLNSPYKAGYNYSEIHKVPLGNTTEELIKDIQNKAIPDVIIGAPDYSKLYSLEDFNFNEYSCVYEVSGGIIWKGVPEMNREKIYIKE